MKWLIANFNQKYRKRKEIIILSISFYHSLTKKKWNCNIITRLSDKLSLQNRIGSDFLSKGWTLKKVRSADNGIIDFGLIGVAVPSEGLLGLLEPSHYYY
jgi:hypothetical protein